MHAFGRRAPVQVLACIVGVCAQIRALLGLFGVRCPHRRTLLVRLLLLGHDAGDDDGDDVLDDDDDIRRCDARAEDDVGAEHFCLLLWKLAWWHPIRHLDVGQGWGVFVLLLRR